MIKLVKNYCLVWFGLLVFWLCFAVGFVSCIIVVGTLQRINKSFYEKRHISGL